MSRYPVKLDVDKKMSELLFELLGRINDKEKFIATLYDMLSPIERLMLGKRLLIMYMVFLGIDYDTIIDVVKVSRATISKHMFLLERSNQIQLALRSIVMKGKFHTVMNEIFESFIKPGFVRGNWKSASKFQSKMSKRKQRGF